MQFVFLAIMVVSVLLIAPITLASLASPDNLTDAAQSSARFKIGIIKSPGRFLDECGCSLRFLADKNNHSRCVFLSDLDDNARMNIDGKDVKLTFGGRIVDKGRVRIGSRSTEFWDADGVVVKIDYVVTRLSSEDYEANDYIATITATRGKQKRIVKLVGSCGC